MKKKVNNCLLLFLVIFLWVLVTGEKAYAQENGGADFSTKPIFEKHQTDDKLGYWRLDVKSGQEITIYIQINNGKNKNTFDITSNQAITNSNFVIDYSLKEEETKDFLSRSTGFDYYRNISIGESTGSRVVVLEPGEIKKVPIKIKVPKSWADKIAIGGINVTRRANDKEKSQSLLNIYSSAFALILQSGAQAKSSDLSLSPGKLNMNEQSVRIQNNSDTLQEKTKLHASIKDKKGVIYSSLDYASGAIVPYADVNLDLQMEKKLKKGNQYELNIETEQGSKNLKEVYLLEVDNKGNVKATPQTGKSKENNQQKYYLWIGVATLSATAVGLVFYGLNKRKEKK